MAEPVGSRLFYKLGRGKLYQVPPQNRNKHILLNMILGAGRRTAAESERREPVMRCDCLRATRASRYITRCPG